MLIELTRNIKRRRRDEAIRVPKVFERRDRMVDNTGPFAGTSRFRVSSRSTTACAQFHLPSGPLQFSLQHDNSANLLLRRSKIAEARIRSLPAVDVHQPPDCSDQVDSRLVAYKGEGTSATFNES